MNKNKRNTQSSFFKTDWKTRYSSGGDLRKTRLGRRARPLSSKHSLHVVFKAGPQTSARFRSPRSFQIISDLIWRYARRFHIKIETHSIQGNHIHFLIRAPKRSSYQNFFRVLAGQIAQRLGASMFRPQSSKVTDTPTNRVHEAKHKVKFWQERPFSRVVFQGRAWKIAWAYIELNEKEAKGEIPYRKTRLKGLSAEEWALFTQFG